MTPSPKIRNPTLLDTSDLPTLTDILELEDFPDNTRPLFSRARETSDSPLPDSRSALQLELPLENISEDTSMDTALHPVNNNPHVRQTVDRIQTLVSDLVEQYSPTISAHLTAELTRVVHDYLQNAQQSLSDSPKKP